MIEFFKIGLAIAPDTASEAERTY